jgi:hypothetical protein
MSGVGQHASPCIATKGTGRTGSLDFVSGSLDFVSGSALSRALTVSALSRARGWLWRLACRARFHFRRLASLAYSFTSTLGAPGRLLQASPLSALVPPSRLQWIDQPARLWATNEHAGRPKHASRPLSSHLYTGVAITRSGGRLLREHVRMSRMPTRRTSVRLVGEGQHAQHVGMHELARRELVQTFIRRSRFGGVNFLAPSRPSRPIEGHPSQTPCFHGSGPNRTAIAFVRFARRWDDVPKRNGVRDGCTDEALHEPCVRFRQGDCSRGLRGDAPRCGMWRI